MHKENTFYVQGAQAHKTAYCLNLQECNAANRTYTCAINQFGDWTAEERRTLLRRNGLTGRTTGAQNKEYKYMKPHEPVVPLHFLPTTVRDYVECCLGRCVDLVHAVLSVHGCLYMVVCGNTGGLARQPSRLPSQRSSSMWQLLVCWQSLG